SPVPPFLPLMTRYATKHSATISSITTTFFGFIASASPRPPDHPAGDQRQDAHERGPSEREAPLVLGRLAERLLGGAAADGDEPLAPEAPLHESASEVEVRRTLLDDAVGEDVGVAREDEPRRMRRALLRLHRAGDDERELDVHAVLAFDRLF